MSKMDVKPPPKKTSRADVLFASVIVLISLLFFIWRAIPDWELWLTNKSGYATIIESKQYVFRATFSQHNDTVYIDRQINLETAQQHPVGDSIRIVYASNNPSNYFIPALDGNRSLWFFPFFSLLPVALFAIAFLKGVKYVLAPKN